MECGLDNQEFRLPKDLKQQLAIAVRSINWSYGIFWSISASQPGVLEWGDGYYNGDIKTRKTIQEVEFNADELGIRRSEQLRELYESLSLAESNGHIKRPSAALSPEDLTDTEWYYLVCMSFHFDIEQGLPGRTLSTGQPIWLCDAQYADSKVFSRSLLAKSASIETVVCIPFLGGVVELGVTNTVPEDLSLIQHVEAFLLGNTNLRWPMNLHHDFYETRMIPIAENPKLVSPTTSSNGFEAEGTNIAASQPQSLQFMDEDFSNCLHHSVTSSDCISQTFIDPGNVVQLPVDEHEREENDRDESGLDVRDDDFHYQGILSSLLKTSKELIFGPNLEKVKRESSFRAWKNGGSGSYNNSSHETRQMMLKSVLFEVPLMHRKGLAESPSESSVEKNGVWKPEADEVGLNHALAERGRRAKLNERFTALKSIIPSISKVDKVSILDDTIEYLKTLERRVKELAHDTSERTCDNYGGDTVRTSKRPSSVNKRKSDEIGDKEIEIDYDENLLVSVEGTEVVVEMKCKWRDGTLLEIVNVASSLRLDCHSVQSSISDGILSLSVKSKFVGSGSPSARAIKQVMQRFARNRS